MFCSEKTYLLGFPLFYFHVTPHACIVTFFYKAFYFNEAHVPKENNIVSYAYVTVNHISWIFYQIQHNIYF